VSDVVFVGFSFLFAFSFCGLGDDLAQPFYAIMLHVQTA
jgi:hypothetical protein